MRIKAPKDFWAGLMFIAFGLGFVIVARDYSMGTAIRMGPAYFPTILGSILAFLGLVLAGGSLTTEGEAVPKMYARPLLVVLVALVLFGFLLRPAGLVVAAIALIVTSMLAAGPLKPKHAVPLALGLTAFSVLVFHYGLGLPFKIWPWE